jgi:uncharacterized protein YqeY
LKNRIQEDIKVALKAGDRLAVETCRMLLAGIKNEEIAKRRPLTDEETAAVLTRAVKTREDAVALYSKGGRPELAEKERREIEIVRRYLPAQLSREEVAVAIDEIIRELGVSSKKEMGRVMKALMSRHPGRVDGRIASEIAGSRLD